MKNFLIIPFFSLGLLFAMPAFAADWFVDGDNGNDAVGNGSQIAPYATVTKAVTSMVASDTVYCRGTVSDNSITLPVAKSGAEGAPTTITAWEGYDCTIDAGSNDHIINVDSGGSYFKFSNLILTNARETAILGEFSHSEISDNVIYGIEGGTPALPIWVALTDSTISGNLIYGDGNDKYGIYFPGSQNLVIEGNIIHDFLQWGIGADISYGGITIKNNFIYNIGGDDTFTYPSGVLLLQMQGVDIINNSFYDISDDVNNFAAIILGNAVAPPEAANILNNVVQKADYGIMANSAGLTGANINYNDYYEVDKIAIVDAVDYVSLADWQASAFGPDANSLSSDPLFNSITAGSEDLHLTDPSPCIDAGTNLDSTTNDIDEEDRPYHLLTDIGADERPVLASPPEFSGNEYLVKKVNFNWLMDSAYAVTGYRVRVSENENFSSPKKKTVGVQKHGTVKKLKPAKKYYGAVRAIYTTSYATYMSDFSDTLTLSTKPAQVKNIEQIDTGLDYAQFRWPKQKRVRNYAVKLMNSHNKKIRLIQISKKKSFVNGRLSHVKKKIIKNLDSNTTYKIKIRGKKKVDGTWYKGKWSKIKTFTTL
ncbi:MAG: right-handed parallel beta-helix repeat-containing protein [Patescibacteria group bacterium]